MRRIKFFYLTLAALSMILSFSAFAASTEETEEVCKPPKITDFTLPEYSQPERVEVPAEADFSFKIAGDPDPNKIRVMAKDKILKTEISSNTSFTLVKSKLTPELTGKFVRLDIIVGTKLGCKSQGGWLIKVKA